MLYAHDLQWWESEAGQRARSQFKGDMYAGMDQAAAKFGLHHAPTIKGQGAPTDGKIYTGGNSGYQAVQLALMWGASEIILIGFTMKAIDGKNHWHRDHKHSNPNTTSLNRWVVAFNSLPLYIDKSMIKVYGESAITAFDKVDRL